MFVDYDKDLAEIGVIEPVFVEEFDYFATRQIVMEGEVEVMWVHEMSSELPVQMLPYRYEDIPPTPQYKTTLRWKKV